MGTTDIDSRILLIGDAGKVFLDADVLGGFGIEVCANTLDGIDKAVKSRFDAIAVVIPSTQTELNSALKLLKRHNQNTKIILLAQMSQEPAAMNFVGSADNGGAVADDYLICPVRVDKFYHFIVHGSPMTHTPMPPAIDIGAAAQIKIKQLEKLATEDELTGLKNRRYIWEFARQIIEHAKKENAMVTLLVFDIDNFKHYNDVYSHSAGDDILKQAAILMSRCCREHDVVGRIGGDEFAVIFWDDPHRKALHAEGERRLTQADHPKEAIFIAKRFRSELGNAELHLLGPEGRGILTISGGLATFPRDGSTIQQLFQQADNALLEAKRSGKNRIYLVGRPDSDIADIE
jgi:GGDEF domain-containing protein